MNIDTLVKEIRADLKKSGTLKGRTSFQRFFKERVKCYGLKSADVGKVSKKYWKVVEGQSKEFIFELCEKLFSSDYSEDAFIASSFSLKEIERFKPADFEIFESWVEKYINNWAKCDGFCTGSVAVFLKMYPSYIVKLKTWARSKNIWVKRASAVSLIPLAKNGKYLNDVFEIADILLTDPSDMVQKGYGWLLKEASRKHQSEVLKYVVKHKKVMPRTALRYSIELMPKDLKSLAMKKDW